MKLLVIGHGKHGKDTVGNVLAEEMNLVSLSSSWAACREFLFHEFLDQGRYYESPQACWEDRDYSDEMRAHWFDSIAAFNTPDKTAMAKLVLSQADIYTGLRSREEYEACKAADLFDLVIWVEAFKRKPAEPETSMHLCRDDADIMFDNNGTQEQLTKKIRRLCRSIKSKSIVIKDFWPNSKRALNDSASCRPKGTDQMKPRPAPVAQMPAIVPVIRTICPGCGDQHPPGAGRCEECGYDITKYVDALDWDMNDG